MATPFTSAQKASIRLYMGWSARFHQFDSALEQAMSAIDSEPDDSTHDIIVADLTALDDLCDRLTDSYGRIKAMKVGAIDLPGTNEIGLLRSEGRRVAGRIAATLGVEIRHDVFKGAGPRHRVGFGGPYGGGNVMKHG